MPSTKACLLWTGFYVFDTQQKETWTVMWSLWVSRSPLKCASRESWQEQRGLGMNVSFSVWLWENVFPCFVPELPVFTRIIPMTNCSPSTKHCRFGVTLYAQSALCGPSS